MKVYDAAIIGGGPAGMTAALYLLRAGATLAWIEKSLHGGQIVMTNTLIENYPGFPYGIVGTALTEAVVAQLAGLQYDTVREEVLTIEPGGPVHRLLTETGRVEARALILCTGSEFRTAGVPGETELRGRGVSYCALCDGNFFRGQTIAVVGGGNAALEESLYLAKLVKKIYLIHRRDEFRATKCYQDKCAVEPRIEILRGTVVEEVLGKGQVEGIRVRDLKTGETRELPLEGVFFFVGHKPLTGFVPAAIAKDEAGFIVTDCEMKTSVPGIFAAGDVRAKHCRQIVTAVGDGATAANSALLWLGQTT
jgi:thioredoxin reductase (NADPH)